ncbi:MAG: 30S ribosomal protein S17 [Candidatus Diapherotrites archaeon]
MAKKEKTKVEAREIVEAKIDRRVGTRGKIFEGIVTKKFPKRVVIEFERMIYVKKYERYAKLKTKIHARLPKILEKEINLGDLIRVHECRPLSKIIHFVIISKVKDAKEVGK